MSAPAPTESGARRVDGSMSLLVDVMTNTLDEAYAERAAHKAGLAQRPAHQGTPPPSAAGRVAGVALLVVLGIVTGTAVSQVRDRADASAGLRQGLAAEVRDREVENDRLAQEVLALRADVAVTRDSALGADAEGRAAARTVAELELAAGATPVVGPGIVLTLDDAPPSADVAEPQLRGGTPAERRVNDRDLQGVVNGLWLAGAEAVAVNGVRLSSRSAIRSAGEAVLVDFVALSPPYEITALGRPADLEVGFVDGTAGRLLEVVSSATGITWDLDRDDELRLPAVNEPDLRSVNLPGPTS